MPQNAPQSLDNDDVLCGFRLLLKLNGLLAATRRSMQDALCDQDAERTCFVSDPRSDVKTPACMTAVDGALKGPLRSGLFSLVCDEFYIATP